MLDWNDLRFALAVSREGSLSGAARALGVHQSTVGRRLETLEAALGVKLFVRSPTGLTTTADGAQVLESIDELAASLVLLERGVLDSRESVRGLVRVAVTETTARQLVEGALPSLLEEHPELCVELVVSNTVADLTRGDAELAVRLVGPDEGLVARRLGMVRYGLYASDAYLALERPQFLAGLAGHDVVVPARELSRGPEARWLAEHGAEARRRLASGSLITLAHAVARGIGICPLPVNLANMVHGVRLVRPLPEIQPRPVWLVMPPELRGLPRLRPAANAIAAELRRRLA